MDIFSERNTNLNSVFFCVVLQTGAADDGERVGLTHFTEHMCFRKAGELDQDGIYDRCERLGVKIDGTTGKNFVKFNFFCRPEVFAEAFSIFSRMLAETAYGESEIAAEKRVVMREAELNEPTNGDLLIDSRWEDERLSCSILGEAADIESFTVKEVEERKREMLGSPKQVFLLGNFGEEDLAAVRAFFEGLPTAAEHKDADSCAQDFCPADEEEKITIVQDEYDLCDVYYSFYFNEGTSDVKTLLCLQMIQSALFQGDAAYVTQTMRERAGLIYDVDSRLVTVGRESVLLCNFFADKEILLKTVNLFEKLLGDFTFDERYLSYIRAFFCDNVAMLGDNFKEYAMEYVYNYIDFGAVVSPQKKAEILSGISVEEFDRVYKKLLKTRRIACFGNVPKETVKALRAE